MKIEWVKIFSFRSFRETGPIPLDRKRIIVVGKNDAGKSALLEALTLRGDLDDPHRSVETVLFPGAKPPGTRVDFRLGGDADDLARILRSGDVTFSIPVPDRQTTNVNRQLDRIQKAQAFELKREGGTWSQPYLNVAPGPEKERASFRVTPDKETPTHFNGNAPDLREQLLNDFRARIFRFRAERFSIDSWPVEDSLVELNSDASNLPAVLHALLVRDRHAFDEFCRAVNEILPSVRNVQVPVKDGKARAVIWHHGAGGRDDLAIPLSACGTGVSQVLAITCALYTARRPMTFLIDEPNSFLHPSAVFALLRLLRAQQKHRYVMATHSPEVIAAADPDSIIQLELVDGETRVILHDPREVTWQKQILSDLGVRLSSVFGADRILWVEGPTEEQCFPDIVRHFDAELPLGTAIVSVADTAGFRRKTLERTSAIYDRLTNGVGIVPVATGFFFDREGLTDEEVQRRCSKMPKLSFTQRRMAESYLLHPGAIAAVLTDDGAERVDAGRVEKWLADNATTGKFSAAVSRAEDADAWATSVHAANLLEELFSELSETRVAFEKPSTPVGMVRWLLDHEPEWLRPMFDEVARALAGAAAAGDTLSDPSPK